MGPRNQSVDNENALVLEEAIALQQLQRRLFATQIELDHATALQLQRDLPRERAEISHLPIILKKKKVEPVVAPIEESDPGLPVMFGFLILGTAIVLAYPMISICIAIGVTTAVAGISIFAAAGIISLALIIGGFIANNVEKAASKLADSEQQKQTFFITPTVPNALTFGNRAGKQRLVVPEANRARRPETPPLSRDAEESIERFVDTLFFQAARKRESEGVKPSHVLATPNRRSLRT